MPLPRFSLPALGIPLVVRQRLVRFLLKRALGRFISTDIENLDVQLASGKITLSDLSLNTRAFDQYLAPLDLRLVDGSLARVSVTVPWRDIWEGEIHVELDNFTAVVAPSQNGGSDRKSVYEDLVASKVQLAKEFMKEPTLPVAEPGEETVPIPRTADDDNPLVKLIEDVVARIKISMTGLTISLRVPPGSRDLVLKSSGMHVTDVSDEYFSRIKFSLSSLSLETSTGSKVLQFRGEESSRVTMEIDRRLDKVTADINISDVDVAVSPDEIRVLTTLFGVFSNHHRDLGIPGQNFRSQPSPPMQSPPSLPAHRLSGAWQYSQTSSRTPPSMYETADPFRTPSTSTGSLYSGQIHHPKGPSTQASFQVNMSIQQACLYLFHDVAGPPDFWAHDGPHTRIMSNIRVSLQRIALSYHTTGDWNFSVHDCVVEEFAGQGSESAYKSLLVFDEGLPDSEFQVTQAGKLEIPVRGPDPGAATRSFRELQMSHVAESRPPVMVSYAIAATSTINIDITPFLLDTSERLFHQLMGLIIDPISDPWSLGKANGASPSSRSGPGSATSPTSQVSDPLEYLIEDLWNHPTSGRTPAAPRASKRGPRLVNIACPFVRVRYGEHVIIDTRALQLRTTAESKVRLQVRDVALFGTSSNSSPQRALCFAKITGRSGETASPSITFSLDAIFSGTWALEMPTEPKPGVEVDLPLIWLELSADSISCLRSLAFDRTPPTNKGKPWLVFCTRANKLKVEVRSPQNPHFPHLGLREYTLVANSIDLRGYLNQDDLMATITAKTFSFSESGEVLFKAVIRPTFVPDPPMFTAVFRKSVRDSEQPLFSEYLFSKTQWDFQPWNSATFTFWTDLIHVLGGTSPGTPPVNGCDIRIETRQRPERSKRVTPQIALGFQNCALLYRMKSQEEVLILCEDLEVDVSGGSAVYDISKLRLFLVEDIRRLDFGTVRTLKSSCQRDTDFFFVTAGYVRALTSDSLRVISRSAEAATGGGMEICIANDSLELQLCPDSFKTLIDVIRNLDEIPRRASEQTFHKDIACGNLHGSHASSGMSNAGGGSLDILRELDEDTFRFQVLEGWNHAFPKTSHVSDEAQNLHGAAGTDVAVSDYFDIPQFEPDSVRRSSHGGRRPSEHNSFFATQESAAHFLLEDDTSLELIEEYFVLPKRSESESVLAPAAVGQPFELRLKLDQCCMSVLLHEGLDWIHKDFKKKPAQEGSTMSSLPHLGGERPQDRDHEFYEVPEYGVPKNTSIPRTGNRVCLRLEGVDALFTLWRKGRGRSEQASRSPQTPSMNAGQFQVSTASHLSLTVGELEVVDEVSSSTWNKFATRLKDASFDFAARPMINLSLTGVLVSPTEIEYRARLSLVPLRFNIDQDALNILLSFIPQEPSQDQDIFFQSVVVDPIHLRMDYKPKHLNYKQLRHGNFVELLNFFSLEGATMTLKQVKVNGIKGLSRLCEALVSKWVPSIKPGAVVEGVGAVRSLKNLGKGMADLVLLPIDQYIKDGRIVAGLQRGAQTFARTAVEETLDLSARLAVGAQVLLEHADNILNTGNTFTLGTSRVGDDGPYALPDIGTSSSSSSASKYSSQPSNIKEGITQAWRVLGRTIVAVPTEVSDGRQMIKAVPVAVLRPMIGATEAASKALLGMRNSVNPRRRMESEDKYKHDQGT